MLNITKPDKARYLKMMVYGPSGQGKTRFMASAQDDPRTLPALVLDAEAGTDSLAGKDIDVARIVRFADFNEVYRHLTSPDNKYKSVIFDSATELQQMGLLEILKADSANRRDKDAYQQQDWGKILLMMRRLVRQFRDLPVHTFFSALAKDDIDPRAGQIKKPRFQGSFAEDMISLMDVVSYLALAPGDKEGEVKRVLLLNNQAQFRVKCRVPYEGNVPDAITDPTVGKLLDVLSYN